MRVVIDRFEGEMAVCEKPDRTMVNIPRNDLPPLAREGDVLVVEGNSIHVDPTQTAARRKRAKNLMKDLWKGKLLFILAVGFSLAVGACSSAAPSTAHQVIPGVSSSPVTTFQNVTAEQAFTLVQNNLSNPDFVIIDVRTPEEFDSGHIAGAILMDFYAADFKDNLAKLDKAKQYFVYCRSGNRSGQASRIMVDMGFKSVYNLDAGITDWTNLGYPVVK